MGHVSLEAAEIALDVGHLDAEAEVAHGESHNGRDDSYCQKTQGNSLTHGVVR